LGPGRTRSAIIHKVIMWSPVSLIIRLYHAGGANLPRPHVPPRRQSRIPGARIPRARPAPHPRRRSLGRDPPLQAPRRQRRPRHGGDQEQEDYGYHCWLDERLEVPCVLLQVHQRRVHVSRTHRRPLRHWTKVSRVIVESTC